MKDLSEREKEVLRLIAKGFKSREIAKKLFVSENTIKAHVSSILTKLKARNRTSAVANALKNNVI